VEYGLKTMAGLLANSNLIVTDRCTGFIQEVTGYSWDEKKAKEGKDAPIKVADHYMDASRYAVTTTENQWADHIRT
jgi:phage terminase large subunit